MRFSYFSLLSWAVYVVYGAIAITLVSHRGPIAYCPSGTKELKGLLYRHVLIPVRKS